MYKLMIINTIKLIKHSINKDTPKYSLSTRIPNNINGYAKKTILNSSISSSHTFFYQGYNM